MRTHATRHFDVTIHFSKGKNVHGLVRSALLDHDGDARSSSCGAQSQRARELGGFGGIAEHEERGVGFACEAGEADGDGALEDGRAVEDDERERAAAEEDVGAPCAARGRVGAHDPESLAIPLALTCAQSRGASVRVASMYATDPPSCTVRSAIRRTRVVLPEPGVPTSSVRRPRGRPRLGRAASSSASPVVRPGVPGAVPAMISERC